MASAYPGQWGAEPTASRVAKAAVTPADAVVSLAPKSGAAAAGGSRASRPPARRAELRQRHQEFVPRVLPITVGSTVDFPNDDPFYHNVFSYSSAKRFDLGRYGKGKSSAQTFDHPGLVKVFCDIHSDMAAYVVVLETSYYASPVADGGFVIRDVPPGDYTVTSWHPDLGEWSGEVAVPAEGAAALDIDMR
jgi:plastocyanin